MPPHKKEHSKPHPYRKPKPTPAEGAAPAPSAPNAHKVRPTEERAPDALPGLSKLKSAIRQTKRLLAKDNLEPGLRVSTQRRLTSLEADLAAAERREVEKKNGQKYHMVKFFGRHRNTDVDIVTAYLQLLLLITDRQKLLRIIKRLNRKLSEEDVSDKKRTRYEEELRDARVMLNYVLHFPNSQKYIALFPSSSVPQPTPTPSDPSEPKLKLPALLHPVPTPSALSAQDKPSQRRYELLQETSRLMEEGKLGKEPEEDLKKGEKGGVVVGAGVEIGLGKKEVGGKKEAQEEDDFFESD
ncbi:hypothetical protein IAT38_007217 [Cryptococcus sp. DSM 104549]